MLFHDDVARPAAVDAAGSLQRSDWNKTKRTLVAVDGSCWSADAVAFAVDCASGHRSELIFVHVVPLIDAFAGINQDFVGVAVPHQPTQRDHELLEEAAAIAAVRGVAATTASCSGQPPRRSWRTVRRTTLT